MLRVKSKLKREAWIKWTPILIRKKQRFELIGDYKQNFYLAINSQEEDRRAMRSWKDTADGGILLCPMPSNLRTREGTANSLSFWEKWTYYWMATVFTCKRRVTLKKLKYLQSTTVSILILVFDSNDNLISYHI